MQDGWLTYLFGPFAELIRNAWTRWQVARTKIDLNEKCPSCGHRSGRIEHDRGMVRHTCHVCGYSWAEPTVMELPDATD